MLVNLNSAISRTLLRTKIKTLTWLDNSLRFLLKSSVEVHISILPKGMRLTKGLYQLLLPLTTSMRLTLKNLKTLKMTMKNELILTEIEAPSKVFERIKCQIGNLVPRDGCITNIILHM